MSLNGYERQTNFYTGNLQNFVSFSDFTSCAAATKFSVPCIFAAEPRVKFDYKTAKFRQNLLNILQKAGLNVFWFEKNANDCKGACDQLSTQNIRILNKAISQNAQNFDNEVFDLAKDKINELKSSQNSAIIVLHIRGSHGLNYDST